MSLSMLKITSRQEQDIANINILFILWKLWNIHLTMTIKVAYSLVGVQSKIKPLHSENP